MLTLIDRHGPIVHRVCLDVLGSPHEAEDAAQAVFLVLARKARSIRKPESLGPWLHGVALRVARRARREAARRRVAERNKAEIMRQRQTAESGPEPMDYAELHEEIDRLPEKYRRPIILCYMQGQTQTQAARDARLAPGNGPDSPAPRPGTVAVKADAPRCRPDRSDQLRPGDVAHGTSRRARARLDRDDGPRRGPVCRRSRDGRAGRAAGDRTGRVRARGHALRPLKVFSLCADRVLSRRGRSLLELPRRTKFTAAVHDPGPKLATARRNTNAMPDAKAALRNAVAESSTRTIRPRDQPKPETAADSRGTARPRRCLSPDPPVDDRRSLEVADRRQADPRVWPWLVGRSEKAPTTGRELFERVWVKNDPRGHGVTASGRFSTGNRVSAATTWEDPGGAGGIDRNIEIVTVGLTTLTMKYTGYSYSFSMDFGAGRFEYRFGRPPRCVVAS